MGNTVGFVLGFILLMFIFVLFLAVPLELPNYLQTNGMIVTMLWGIPLVILGAVGIYVMGGK